MLSQDVGYFPLHGGRRSGIRVLLGQFTRQLEPLLVNAKTRGELLDAKRVASEWASTLTDLRAAILAIPQRVAGRVVG